MELLERSIEQANDKLSMMTLLLIVD